MRTDILTLVCCPACGGRLRVETIADQSDGEIVAGRLECTGCGQLYPIEQRLPLLYVNDQRWAPKAREAIGWVKLHKKLGIYEQSQDAVDLKIPYYPQEPWLTTARHFDVGLKVANLSGHEMILDLGAGRGWAAKHFALKGCYAIAIDIVPDEQVGLGRAYALMDHASVHFEPVIGDSENLPFIADTFDIVFGAAVLHHTSNLPLLLQNVYKVLKPNGRLIAISEPCISLSDDPRKVLEKDAADELALGINENRPTYLDYWTALKKAGFDDVDIFPLDAYSMNEAEMEGWAVFLKAIPAYRGMRRIRHLSEGWSDEVRWWQNAWQARSLPRPRTKREALLRAVLINVSNGVIIVARKGA
jgi:SAM-dependent methyltransferase